MRLAVAEKIRHVRRKSLVGQIVVTLMGVQLLFVSSFVCLQVPIATGNNLNNYLHNQAIFLVAQLPAVVRVQLADRYPDLTQPESDVRFMYAPPVARKESCATRDACEGARSRHRGCNASVAGR